MDRRVLGPFNILNGQQRFPATEFITPFARSWSLNLIDHVIYTSVARGCGGAASNIAAMDLTDPFHPSVAYFFTSTGRPAGAWGRGGIVKGPGAVYAQTADGPYAPSAGAFGQSVVALTFKKLELSGSFTPENWQELNLKDLDFGSASPITFPFQGWTLLAAAGREPVLYLLGIPARQGGGGTTKDSPVRPKQLVPLYQSPHWGNDDAQFWGTGFGDRWQPTKILKANVGFISRCGGLPRKTPTLPIHMVRRWRGASWASTSRPKITNRR